MRGFFQHMAYKYDNETVSTMKEYCNTTKKLVHKKQRLRFLLSCRFYGIIPTHTKNTTSRINKFNCEGIREKLGKIEGIFHEKILNLEISQANVDIKVLKRELYHLKSGIKNFISATDFSSFMTNQAEREKYITVNTKQKHIEKLNTLKKKRFRELGLVLNEHWFENKTEIEIPWEYRWLLSLGKKFALPVNRKNFSPLEVIADIEQCIQNISENDQYSKEKEDARATLANKIALFNRKLKNTQKEKFILAIYNNTFRFLKRHRNIIITQSDKGNKTVVMYKKEYEEKMENLLQEKTTYRVIRSDPTNKLTKINNNIVTDLYKKELIDYTQKRILTCSAATAPRIYGLPKIHKEGIPLRPIVSSFQVPCFKLSQYLGQILRNIVSKQYNIKNSIELKNQLKSVKLEPNNILASLDVVSLFTNIPIHTAINNIMKKWNTISTYTTIPKSKFLDILKFCLHENNYFAYNNKFYNQIFGMPMGNPLSPTIADIVLDNLLDVVLADLRNKNIHIKFITKYVDDIFLVINIDDKTKILDAFNGYHHKINFTIELEKERKISYLDTTLHRQDDKISFDWYTKNIASGRIINYNSNQPKSQIINTAKNLINKVSEICDVQYNNNNMEKLTKILKDNSFPKHIINNLTKLHKFPQNNRNGNPNMNNKKYFSTKYIPGLTDSNNIKFTINKNNTILAYKPNKTLNTIFTNTKTPIEKLQQNNVVYQIPCKGDAHNNCDLVYIGTTKRCLGVRINEHMMDISKNKESTALSKHIMQTKHTPDFQNVTILNKESNAKKRYTTESLRIQQKINKTMNKKEDTDNLSAIYRFIIKNSADKEVTSGSSQ